MDLDQFFVWSKYWGFLYNVLTLHIAIIIISIETWKTSKTATQKTFDSKKFYICVKIYQFLFIKVKYIV